jgi:hypothetical protein
MRLRLAPMFLVICLIVGVQREARAASDPAGFIVMALFYLIAEGVDRYGDDVAKGASMAADALVRAEAGLPPIVRGSLHRARRAIAFGPRGGLAASYSPSPSRGEMSLSLGLALEIFGGPILPSTEELRAWLIDGLKTRIVAVARDLAARGGPPLNQEQLRPYAQEILAAVHADVSSRMAVSHRYFPPPRFGIAMEFAGQTETEKLELRLTIGIGVGPVSVGPTAAFHAERDDPGVLVGAEVAGHLVTRDRMRSPVLDLFLRLELAARENPVTSHQGTLGLRFLLDVI